LDSQSLSQEFGTIRSFIWPIRRHEARKMLPMLLMMFLICFNYSILRCIKDSVVVTASSAEVLPFIKVWAVLPMAVVLTLVFTKLTNRFSQEQVCYMMTTGFLLFYALFAFVLYPKSDVFHPHALADSIQAMLPRGFVGLVSMFRYWTFTLFYVLAELWSSIVLTVIFWGFANEITKVTEAKRFYAVLTIGSNIAATVAGQAANYFSVGGVYNPKLPFGSNAFEQTLMISMSVIIVSGAATMLIFRWMNKKVLNDPQFDELHFTRWEIKKKKKMSVRESFNFLSNSKYLVCIAVMVVAYNLVINMVEVVWKNQLREVYASPSDYYRFMNNLTTSFGLVSTVTALFLPRIIGRFGWTSTALITPMIMLVTSLGFFAFLLFGNQLGGSWLAMLGMSPMMLVVMFGAMQNCLSKAAKYSVFDATKEISFIPLDHEVKLKGKAAIDGVGSRFGKSGGSFVHQGLLMVFGSLSASAPYVAAILMGVIAMWIAAVKSLGRQFQEITQEGEPQKDRSLASAKEQPATS
jgi:ATP:ADP antiporter, AAA family